MTSSLRFELLNSVNLIKTILADAVDEGEISKDERIQIMKNLGQVKQVLYKNHEFKSVYSKQIFRMDRFNQV